MPSAMATPGLSASLVSFVRDTTTGTATYAVDVDGTDLAGFCSGGNCQVLLEFRDTAGTWSNAYSTYYFGSTIEFTGTLGWRPLAMNGARASLLNGGYAVSSSIVPITDSVRSQGIDLSVVSWSRSSSTGAAVGAATIDTSAIPSSACGSSFCPLQLIVEDTEHVEYILYQGAISNFYTDHFEWSGNYGRWTTVYRIKAVYGSLSSSWVSVADSVQATGIGLAVDSFSRNDSTARVSWAAQIDISALPSSACGTSFCALKLVAELEGGEEVTIDQGAISNYYGSSYSWSGAFSRWDKVLRLQARWGTLFSAWVEVEDSPREERLQLSNVVFNRDQTTGYVAWAADIEVSAIDPNCPNYPCRPKLYAEDYDGNEYIMYDGVFTSFYHDTQTWAANFGVWKSIKRIQVRYLDVSSNWVEVNDTSRETSTNLVVHTFLRDPSTGNLTWAIDANTSAVTPGNCVTSNCYVEIVAKDEFDVEHVLGRSPVTSAYTQTSVMTGTYSGTAKIVNLKARYGDVESGWLTNSESVKGGHDLDAAAGMLVAGVGSGVSATLACTVIFGFGTHLAHSSLSDQDLACRSTAGTVGILAAVRAVLANEGATYVAALLAAMGIAASTTGNTYAGALPTGCVWQLMEIACSDGVTTTITRPDDAAPPMDPTYENNLQNESQQNDPKAVDEEVVGALLLFGATVATVHLEMIRTCVAQLAKWNPATDQTFAAAAGLAPDDCGTRNLLFIGRDYPEATDHDVEAIEANPTLMLLTYVQTAPGTTEKTTSKPNWRTYAGCVGVIEIGQQCDEYPYWSTEEGYPPDLPSLKPINGSQNMGQGAKIKAVLYDRCGLAQKPRYSEERKFIVVETTLPITTGYCGAS